MSDESREPGTAETLSEQTHYIIAGTYALLAVTAISLNTLVLVAFIRDRALWTHSNKLVLSIAVGDWLHAVLAFPFGIVANASHGWEMDDALCKWYAFITTFTSFGITLHHCTFAIERAAVINYAVASRSILRKLHFVIVGLWMFALLWSIFPFFGWSAYAHEGASALCSIHWQSSDPSDIAYIACIFFFFYAGPIGAMVTAYSSIFHTVKKMTQNAHHMWGENAAPTLEAVRAESKTARMSFIMSFCFIFAWTPYAVVSLYAVIKAPDPVVSPLVAALPALFAKTAACYNPVIYFLLFKKFRVSLRQTLRPLSVLVSFSKTDTSNANIELVTALTESDKYGSKSDKDYSEEEAVRLVQTTNALREEPNTPEKSFLVSNQSEINFAAEVHAGTC
ncbi:melanopsin-like [Oculina patagonica]